MGLLAFLTYSSLLRMDSSVGDARNMTLMLMVIFGNIHALSSRSEHRSLFKMKFFSNPFLIIAVPTAQLVHIGAMYVPSISQVLQINPVSVMQWLSLLAIASILLLVEELHKYFLRKKKA